ncbi:MAG: 5-formyltetrahydrofolate cyclo-ligase [Clostridia bacterium]|nr:5-formyltetrahydrofolate cyclo-ligase [Clostridia bacterium]
MMTKAQLRARLKERRAAMDPQVLAQGSHAIVQAIVASEHYQNADALLLFAPLKGEVDLLPLVRQARKDRKRVAFPRCNPQAATMEFYLLEEGARLMRGAYGIPEPVREAPLCPLTERTLCLLPALTFDPCGRRLGYGKGYYDRFLATFPGVAAGAVLGSMMVKEVPTEPHDRPVSCIYTEKGLLPCKPLPASSIATLPVPAPEAEEPKATPLGRLEHTISQKCRALATSLGKRAEGLHRALYAFAIPLHTPPLLVLTVFLLLLLSRVLETRLVTRGNELLLVILLQLLIFAPAALVYLRLHGKGFASRLRLRLFRPERLWFLLCVLIMMITGGLLCGILTGGIESLRGNFTLYSTFVAKLQGNAGQVIFVILAYGLLPAVLEELVFRAVLCAEYERYGVPVALLVSALFFAMLHFSFPLFLSYFVLGLLLACTLYVTRSYLAAVLLHLLYNLFCLFGQPYLSAFYLNAGSNEIFLFCLVVLFLLFAAFAAGEARKIYHLYAKRNEDSSYTVPVAPKEFPKRLLGALSTPSLLPCLLLWIVLAILDLV